MIVCCQTQNTLSGSGYRPSTYSTYINGNTPTVTSMGNMWDTGASAKIDNTTWGSIVSPNAYGSITWKSFRTGKVTPGTLNINWVYSGSGLASLAYYNGSTWTTFWSPGQSTGSYSTSGIISIPVTLDPSLLQVQFNQPAGGWGFNIKIYDMVFIG